ncbi:iron ABC transporter substrate-binding protein [Zhengella mangrovi]|uniref:Iron ABC transporter substrate-binding protein n=1 Tax=Zhengella mangrovi TaxID=1982044 RepID=A0A2G1QIK8_9HYPH|nr:zinc ABC transporter substrate-binding protein [Zhengella mangrovi]PHP65319.1 iron ABC transporter substrate-binding protein [Zhengella mangrovi]
MHRIPRRVLAHLVAAVLLVAGSQAAAAGKLKIVATFSVLADMAANVAGEHGEVSALVAPGRDVHNFTPGEADLALAGSADLILWNGLDLETWFPRFYHHFHGVPQVTVSLGVEAVPLDRDAYDGKANPHAWMSPADARRYIDTIRDALMQRDPVHAGNYAANARTYAARLEALAAPLRKTVAGLPEGRLWLATSEDSLAYLARDFGLKELYLRTLDTEDEAIAPQRVEAVVATIRAERIPVIYSESPGSPDPARDVAQQAGIRYGGALPVDSLSGPDGPAPTYLDLMRVTMDTIAQGLAQP